MGIEIELIGGQGETVRALLKFNREIIDDMETDEQRFVFYSEFMKEHKRAMTLMHKRFFKQEADDGRE